MLAILPTFASTKLGDVNVCFHAYEWLRQSQKCEGKSCENNSPGQLKNPFRGSSDTSDSRKPTSRQRLPRRRWHVFPAPWYKTSTVPVPAVSKLTQDHSSPGWRQRSARKIMAKARTLGCCVWRHILGRFSTALGYDVILITFNMEYVGYNSLNNLPGQEQSLLSTAAHTLVLWRIFVAPN
jgi:hypothetical protein